METNEIECIILPCVSHKAHNTCDIFDLLRKYTKLTSVKNQLMECKQHIFTSFSNNIAFIIQNSNLNTIKFYKYLNMGPFIENKHHISWNQFKIVIDNDSFDQFINPNYPNNNGYKNKSLYKLLSVTIHHKGNNGGHFTIFVCNENDEWHHLDDSKVTKVDWQQVLMKSQGSDTHQVRTTATKLVYKKVV